jgi:D-xylose transport system substrate-binding protein
MYVVMKKVGKRISILLLSAIILAASCHNDGNKIKIALMLPTLKIARFQKDKEYFTLEAQKLGCEAIVVEADNIESVQLQQAQDLISQGVKVMVIAAVNSYTGAVMVRNAEDEGIKTICYDGMINNCPLDYMVTFDNKKIGTMMAEYLISKVQKGNILILGGDKSNLNAIQIRNGQEEVLAPYTKDGRIKITFADYIETWMGDEAYIMTKNYMHLTCGEVPVAILGANDNIADGVIQAIEEVGAPMPVITGQDASLLGCQNIMKGKQSMTVYKPIKNLATKAADMAYQMAIGNKVEGVNTTTWNGMYDVPTVTIEMISVDKNNMETTVIADGFQKKDDVLK